MIKKNKERKVIIGVLAFIAVVVLLLVSGIKVPNSLSIFAEVQPLQKWQLIKGTDGQLTSVLMDYETGFSNAFGVTQFQRGESMVFTFAESIKNKQKVSEGDTIGVIRSSDVEENLVKLEGELSVAKAELQANKTGEKAPLITEAKNRLEFAKAKLGQKKDTFKRNEQLFQKGFLPQEQYETDLWEIKQLEIEISIYQSQLEAITSGLKPETLNLLESKITALSQELNALKQRAKNFVVVAPINGTISRSFSSDTLLSILNVDNVVVNVPLKVEYKDVLKEGSAVSVSFAEYDTPFKARLLSLSKEVKMLNREQVVVAVIMVENLERHLLPGMITPGKLHLEPVTVWTYLSNYILK